MGLHKFRVGQTVMFSPPTLRIAPSVSETDALPKENYEVIQLLPASGADLQYRIKGGKDDQERMVTERELTA